MEEKIETIIRTIEESFNKLNTSVEQLQKAENIASSSVVTTSTLITEFESSIKTIEKLVKVDFANEYNKLADLNNKLLEKINKVDFNNKFQSVEQKIVDKNFDSNFSELNRVVANINFDNKFQSVEQKIVDKNYDKNFSELKTVVRNINFDNKFQSVEQKILDKNFDNSFSELNTAVKNINFDTKFQSVEQKILDKNFDTKFQSIEDSLRAQKKDIWHLKTLIYIVIALIIICAISLF